MTDYDELYDEVAEDFEPQQFLEDSMDAISDLPEEGIRSMFSDSRLSRESDFKWTIGGTEYVVVSHFKKKSAETIVDKLERLLESEVSA